eukprot:scaffold706_cov418-Prasinococcus_capsulatus_cf.AAC.5
MSECNVTFRADAWPPAHLILHFRACLQPCDSERKDNGADDANCGEHEGGRRQRFPVWQPLLCKL